jgi:predicted membrane protein
MAFKIVYFFIVFIVATFGLLYAYFQMNKKELEQEQQRQAIKHNVRNKNFGNTDHTFFDFLAGSIDEEHYNVNPYALSQRASTRASE